MHRGGQGLGRSPLGDGHDGGCPDVAFRACPLFLCSRETCPLQVWLRVAARLLQGATPWDAGMGPGQTLALDEGSSL